MLASGIDSMNGERTSHSPHGSPPIRRRMRCSLFISEPSADGVYHSSLPSTLLYHIIALFHHDHRLFSPSPTVVVAQTSSPLPSLPGGYSGFCSGTSFVHCLRIVNSSGKHPSLFRRDAFPDVLCQEASHSHVGTSLRMEHIIR